jgi:hypothetical protein
LLSLIAIDFVRNKGPLSDYGRRAIGGELAEEATAVAFMANTGADRLDQKEKRIRVTVEADFAEPEHVTAGFPFFPKAIAGARKKVDLSGELGLSKRSSVKVTEHQNFAGAMVLNNAGNETTKFFERQGQESLPRNKNPAGRRASGLIRA